MATKKKITIGLSSKNGQKYLLERYKIARKENDEQMIEDIDNFLDSEDVETAEIFFRKPSLKGVLLGGSDEAWQKYAEEQQKELIENTDKLQLLCDHYGIENDRFKYLNLSIELARELYPEPGKKGRTIKWTEELICILIIEMEDLMSSNADTDNNKGISWAADRLAKHRDWQDFVEKKDCGKTTPSQAETLRTQYQRNHNKINPQLKQRLENYSPEDRKRYKDFLMRKKPPI